MAHFLLSNVIHLINVRLNDRSVSHQIHERMENLTNNFGVKYIQKSFYIFFFCQIDWLGIGKKNRKEQIWEENMGESVPDIKSKTSSVKLRSNSRRSGCRSRSRSRSARSHRSVSFLDTRQSLGNGNVCLEKKISHWKDDTVTDSKALIEDDMTEKEVDDLVNKFIKCVNILYFDDEVVARKMDDVIKNEIKKNK